MNAAELQNFYCGKKIFLTGHTGFKGSWMALWLLEMKARVVGFALEPEDESLFRLAQVDGGMEKSIIGDIRNSEKIAAAIADSQPEIIIHMAAQPLVRQSYFDPRETYETNVIGTLNVFEAARKVGSIKAILNVATDKCYENKEVDHAFEESDPLGGHDPYSASKACAEILTSSYRRSFFGKEKVALASARAGNVIGGGDFSKDRIIPDIFRSIQDGKKIELRSPSAIRPWQHVLEPVFGYLLLAKNLYEKGDVFAKAYNFGPNADAQQNVETLTKNFIEKIGAGAYESLENQALHEAGILKLNHSLAKKELDWQPKLTFDEAVFWTASWYKNYLEKTISPREFTLQQIRTFI